MVLENKKFKDQFYLILAGIFIASLVTCNLIANKFVTVDLGFKVFIVSAGILPYPFTFLVTDLISELYGQKKANLVVFAGFIASMFVLLFLWLGGQFNAIPDSLVTDQTYDSVFRNAWRIIAASMTAYLFAQFVDVRIFHFWKKLTNGKHLWLRNNASTVVSQLLDTILVIFILLRITGAAAYLFFVETKAVVASSGIFMHTASFLPFLMPIFKVSISILLLIIFHSTV